MKSLQYSQTDPPTLFLFSAAPEFPAVSLPFHSIFSGHFAGLQGNSAHAEAVPDPFLTGFCLFCSAMHSVRRFIFACATANSSPHCFCLFSQKSSTFRSDQQGSFCRPSLRNPYPLQNPFLRRNYCFFKTWLLFCF